MKDALTIHRWLLAHQIHHEIVRLRTPITCADELPNALGLPPIRCIAVHVFESAAPVEEGLVAVMTPAGSPPDLEVIRWLLRSRAAEPASALRINMEVEYRCGLVCPVLLPETVSVFIDQRLAERLPDDEVVYTPTGENHTAVGIRAFDLLSLANAKPVDLRIDVLRVPSPRGTGESARHIPR